jgi:hypothetical protein
LVLAGLALPIAAQQLTITREAPPQTAPKKVDLQPQYLVLRGKVLMRGDKNGVTHYGYENGRLVKEIQPNGVVGTYQYDAKKFTGVVYTDGRYIKASYAPNGALVGLTTDTSARVKFSVQNKPTRREQFAAIQNGIAALRNPSTSNECVGTDDDATCTIIVEDTLPPTDWGGGGGGGGWVDEAPMPSGEGDGRFDPPRDEPPPNECRERICAEGIIAGNRVCRLTTHTPAAFAACTKYNVEAYARCLRSCVDGDWSWLDWYQP